MESKPLLLTRFFTLLCLGLIFSKEILLSSAFAMPANPNVFTDKQPDGTEVTLRIKGDENFHWIEDKEGYTVVRNRGWYLYARLNKLGDLTATSTQVGHFKPANIGIIKGILPNAERRSKSALISPKTSKGSAIQKIAPAGVVKNLVVMVRFANHRSRILPSTSDMDILFNAPGGHATLAPTGSVKDVYLENSYGQMTLNSDISGWINVSQTEQYYANGNSGDSTLWLALKEALEILDQTIDFSQYDSDNDGFIDSITFIHSGYGAEWGGTDSSGTSSNNRIWSHRWAIQPAWTSNENVKVFDYHISPGLWAKSGSQIGRIGVIAHETGHFFGLPDLYDSQNGAGIGSFGLMANSWGFDGSQYYPPHFSAWSKIQLGWVTPTVIDVDGEYSLAEVESNAAIFRIDLNFPTNEYLLIENRQPTGFDGDMPQGGLAIWHIDENASDETEGYPGQAGWPNSGRHYRVALLQADGNYDLEKDNNRGDSGDLYHADGVNAIDPGSFGSYPNTDAYQDGNVFETGHSINTVSAASSVMSFCLGQCSTDVVLAAPSALSATPMSTNSINLNWSDNSTNEDNFELERSLNGINWSLLVSLGANTTQHLDSGLNAATRYYYRVRATEGNNVSGYSNSANTSTHNIVVPAPSALSATPISASSINLNWSDNSVNENNFELERSLDGTNWSLLISLAANTTQHLDSGLNAATRYYYRVRAIEGSNVSGYSNSANTTTQGVVPDPATNLTATAISNSEITLIWNASTNNESLYRVERSTDQSNWQTIATTNAVNYIDTGLASNTTYYYRIFAYNVIGDALTATYDNATTETELPPTPTSIDYTAIAETRTYGSVRRGYRATQKDNEGKVQVITERSSRGRPRRNRYDYLEHRWTFNVEAGDVMTLFANTWKNKRGQDDFNFEYSTDGDTYFPAFIVSSKARNNVQSAVLIPGISGTVYVRVTDTDKTPGNNKRQSIKVDHLYIRSESAEAITSIIK